MPIIANNERISHMNDIKSRKVAQHNDLITSVAKMDKTPLKIFELAVSCIDTDNPPQDNIIYLSKKELFAFFDVSDKGKHSRFKQAIEKMQKQAYFQIKENKDLGIEYESIVPIPTVRWNDYNDEVMVQFNSFIMPYLIDLRKNFTQYAITDIMDLESKYSIILYKWFSMNFNQFETYQFKNNRTKKQLIEYKNPKISMRDLRQLTDTVDLYTTSMSNFEKRVLKIAIKEINEHTHFNVNYKKIKKGRYIDSIQFEINKKKNWKNDEYKNEDFSARLSIEKRELDKKTYYADAMANPYTTQLITSGLLLATDLTKQDTLIELSKNVYPLYDQISENLGKNSLSKHLSYVYSKKIGYDDSKKNIPKYLRIAAEQYLGINN